MKIITVNASKTYDVIVGSNLLSHLSDYLGASNGRKAVIITDSNLWSLYGKTVEDTIAASGFHANHYTVPSGEQSKNPQTYLSIVDYLSSIHFTRNDILLALGGGVVGDLTGFVAATYLRGVSYIQIPTSLLAMVDASVGGKTAIDLPAGKNLLGAFYHPQLVICDLNVLNTLPKDAFRDGCAEIIKYGILFDETLFSHLEKNRFDFDREYVISQCIAHKRDVVAEDEFDTAARQKLNLGHTIGHSIEQNSDYQISHGSAVALGMNVVAKAASSMGLCNEPEQLRIHQLLNQFGFSLNVPFTAQDLCNCALSDKKRSADTINLIIPMRIGECCIMPMPINELLSFIKAGL